MAKEFEHKYLVSPVLWQPQGQRSTITQGYIPTTTLTTVRIRLVDQKAFLTIKGEKFNGCGDEYEYEIPFNDAQEMLKKFTPANRIIKDRYSFIYDGINWTVDVFKGENQGLILAEVEFQNQASPSSLPPWIDKDVTGDNRYFNDHLAQFPYSQWAGDLQVP